ncbi:MAG TPA: hypothetical protein VL907_08700, partial [Pyrinomonadaceae bacterium]|nr:hypothetical protein [Pyrinomonadaceae bacterium]
MQTRSEVLNETVAAVPERLVIERVELRTVRLPLNEPFETSFGRIDSRLIVLVAVTSGGETGWGEVVAAEQPLYSYETVGTALHVIRDYLAPAILGEPLRDISDLAQRLAPFRGHNM